MTAPFLIGNLGCDSEKHRIEFRGHHPLLLLHQDRTTSTVSLDSSEENALQLPLSLVSHRTIGPLLGKTDHRLRKTFAHLG